MQINLQVINKVLTFDSSKTNGNKKDMKTPTARSYTLRTESGQWLGQVVLTSDGMYGSVTDYGNLSYAWRAFGEDFRDFILQLNDGYFADKMATGMAYMIYNKKFDTACKRYAEHILPALQAVLKAEKESGINW